MKSFYNLDMDISLYFDDTRVKNVLINNNINSLFDFINIDIYHIDNLRNCGNKSKEIIINAYHDLKNKIEKNFDIEYIKNNYRSILENKVILSRNSDNQSLKREISLNELQKKQKKKTPPIKQEIK